MPYTLSKGYIADNPDIQILSQNPSTSQSLQCQLCFLLLDNLSIHQREEHYEHHFHDYSQRSASSSSIGVKPLLVNPNSNTSSASKRNRKWNMSLNADKERETFWYPAQTNPPPKNFTPGLIPLLKKSLTKSHGRGNTRRAVLCYDRAVHVHRELWDAGWGCGYRNFLMVCTALMDQPFQPMYFPLLDSPTSPGVRNLQHWIEDAWRCGFDEEGADQLKTLVGTRKWIGTSDLWVAFTFRGIPAQLLDFNLKRDPRGAEVVTDWVVSYFSPPASPGHHNSSLNVHDALRGASPVTTTDRMPLVLQHNGHSSTIVGYEVSKTGAVNLLMFDPSRSPSTALRNAALAAFSAAGSSSASSMPSKQPLSSSSSNTLHGLLHPASSSSHKRCESSTTHPRGAPKHARSDSIDDEPWVTDNGDDDVVIIDDPRIQASGTMPVFQRRNGSVKGIQDEINTAEMLKFFRLDPKSLGKNSKYQILYFPMTEPLSEKQRLRKKVVFSTKIC